MAYTILKSDGTPLTTIPDGTINTTSTSIGLPGRNYAGYGQTLDTNFVHQLENFANDDPPSNPLRGQLWYNTNDSTMYVCPTDGETNEANWLALTSTASGGTTTFGAVTVTGNTQANNFIATNNVIGNAASFNYLSVNTSANLASANITAANIGTLTTTAITTGSSSTPGTLTGAWTVNGLSSPGGNALVLNGNLYISNIGGGSYGIKTDNYYYANGVAISFAGTYTNANVAAYLPTYGGAISASTITATALTSGGVGVAGTITGLWSLVGSSRLQATYADLAERFEADDVYEPGTVVELGGDKEITAVQYELSEDVFGVISDTAAYLMNAGAGNDNTHPPVAVSGRVKVKVTGKIKKGQRLVSAGNGMARGAKNSESNAFNTIGRSLENKTTDDIGTVEAIVIMK
jgi:hypothetical protein